jgi:transposase
LKRYEVSAVQTFWARRDKYSGSPFISYTFMMPKFYSEDFRLRALQRVDGGMSKMAAHRAFGISRSTLDDWLRLRKEQGHVRDKAPARERRGALSDLEVFGEFAARHRHCTLEQMAVSWHKEQGHLLSRNSFSLALKALGWTRKKRVSSTASGASRNARRSRSR